MRTLLLPVALLCLSCMMSSCNKQMTADDMPYVELDGHKFYGRTYLAEDLNPPPIAQRQHLKPAGFNTGGYWSERDYSFILASDIEQFYQASIALRLQILNNFYTHISGTNFNNAEFSNQYRLLLAPNVRAEVRKYAKATNRDNNLYMWQPFTPLPIASKIYVRYEITYDGDDWFSIKPMGDEQGVRLRVVLAGKNMKPVISELKNPAFDVNIGLGNSYSLGKGYTLKQKWEYGMFNNSKYNYSYWNYVADIIYRHCAAMKSGKNFISEAELLAFAEGIERKRGQFLQDFCAALSSADYTAQTFVQKYSDNLTTAFASALIETDKPTAATEDLPSGLQVVLYGKELRPLVVGLSDEALGISIHKDFDDHRDNLWYGISINKNK